MKKLAIIGIGTRRFQQLTLESLSVLKSCDAIGTLETQPEIAEEFCLTHGLVAPEDLNPLYQNGRIDMDNYQAIAQRLIEMLSKKSMVAFLVAGHPRLGVFLTNYLINQAKASGWFEVDVYEGISSFDAMMNVIGRDPLEKGTAIVDINRAILFDYTLNVDMDHYFYHVCSVLNPKTEYEDAQVGNRVDQLQSYLLKHYPGSTPIMLIDAATDALSKSRVVEATIDELDSLRATIRFSTTLFVPGLKPKKINREALRIVRGAEL